MQSFLNEIGPGDRFAVQAPGWPSRLEVTALSPPTREYIGLFHPAILDQYDDPWMFTARRAPTDALVYVVGDTDAAHVAFGQHAASVGAADEVGIEAFEQL